MSGISAKEDNFPAKCQDEVESPPKKMRLDTSGRKSWSLIDRRTDQEVLQEMGVGLLDPDDENCDIVPQPKSCLKRKRDQENVNPNVNSITSPKGKSPRSPLKACSSSPGPSRLRSPRSTEKCKPLQPSDPHILETTFLSDYLIDEETPLNQVNTQYHGQDYIGSSINTVSSSGGRLSAYTPVPLEQPDPRGSSSSYATQGSDSFGLLSDEMLLSVFHWLPKRTLARCMLVCKRWHRVACDETLWQRLDLGNKALAKGALGRILSRQPAVVRLANSEIGEWHPSPPLKPSRIQYLDLSMCSIDELTLTSLLSLCPLLTKLSLEGVKVICSSVAKCTRLETLNLTMAQGITAEGIDDILDNCTSLNSLNISWCNLSEEALDVLVSKLPQRIQRLNLSGARVVTDDMITRLVRRCPRLLELDLSDCSRLSGAALSALLTLTRIEHLALSRCYLLPPHVLTKLSSMPSLQYLEVWGMLQTASLNALKAALPAIQINQFMFSAIARPTVGTRRTSIWGLRTRD